MVTGTIASLAASGAGISDPRGVLGLLATCATLRTVHAKVVAEAGLAPADAMLETYDQGSIANEIALQAERHGAAALAIRYFREAIDKARAAGGWYQLANRLAGLRSACARSGQLQDADTAASELAALLAQGMLADDGLLVAHRALGWHLADRDRAEAVIHLRRACEALERMRQRTPRGGGRSDVGRQAQGLYPKLSGLLLDGGDETASFEALQGEKGRRLIAALAASAASGGTVADGPATAPEILGLLQRLGGDAPTVLVDLAIGDDTITAYLVGDGGIRAVRTAWDRSRLATIESGDVLEREASVVRFCLHEKMLGDVAEAVTTAVPAGCRLLLVPDGSIANLPLHAVPVRGRPWCDCFPIGYLPAAGALRFAPSRRDWLGRSLVAGDSRGDLPHAAAECRDIAAALGTEALTGPERCTRAAVEQALSAGALDIVHLALHGRGDNRRGGRGSLAFSDGRGGTEWVPFEQLAALPWSAELVVFSGCSTAVAGPRFGHELVSVARAAAERGAATVLACLWPVGDEPASTLMTAFYRELVLRRATGPVDLRVVLDRARRRLRTGLDASRSREDNRRDGRLRDFSVEDAWTAPADVEPEVSDARVWAPFVLLGDPVLGA